MKKQRFVKENENVFKEIDEILKKSQFGRLQSNDSLISIIKDAVIKSSNRIDFFINIFS